LSGKLYDHLIRSVENFVHTKNLIVVSHGILHYLPFNTLYNGKEYLIDRYCLSHLPSSSVIKFLKERKVHEGKQVLVFGNPDLGDPKYDLKYAEKEALNISKIFPESKLFLKSEATETAFKNIGGGFNYIHFACHGKFDAGSSLNSGIYLGKDSRNDGRLTVGELYSTRLDTELVTLSACETGMGAIKQGDDVVGLTRGFLYAGSNSIVASLWKVDDVATSQLMAEFYSRLGSTGKREALREAQLIVKAQYKHPYYWAAFHITGKTE
jgi:CHAT domain-containing protein